MPTPRPLQLAPLLLILAASCESSTAAGPGAQLDAAYNALNGQDYADAAQQFESVLTQVSAASDEFAGAKVGQLQALAHTDRARLLEELDELPADSSMNARDYRIVLDELIEIATEQHRDNDLDKSASTMDTAYAILESGKRAHPDYAEWDKLVTLAGDQAKSMGNANNARLTGLGYAGSDESSTSPTDR